WRQSWWIRPGARSRFSARSSDCFADSRISDGTPWCAPFERRLCRSHDREISPASNPGGGVGGAIAPPDLKQTEEVVGYELARSNVRVASPSWIARVFFGPDYSTRAEPARRARNRASARGARRGHRLGWRLFLVEGLTAGPGACS